MRSFRRLKHRSTVVLPQPDGPMNEVISFLRIVIVTSRGREQIEERQVEMLDWADITNVDLIVRPHFWEVSGKSGIKAYVKTMYVTIMEDALELKYGALGNQGDAE